MQTLSRHDLAGISGGFSERRTDDAWLFAVRTLRGHNVVMRSAESRHQYDYDSIQFVEPFFGAIEDIENPLMRRTLKAAIVTLEIATTIALLVDLGQRPPPSNSYDCAGWTSC
ncbi:hypothetical protein GCM10027287_43800 [Bordetella muralis]|jgi:hypothetical protein